MHYSTLSGILSTLAFSSLASAQTICNNSPLLCNRAYDNVTHLGAHDSPFQADVTNNYTPAGNQFYNSIEQLNAGVRLLTAQIHRANDSDSSSAPLHLCHSNCQLVYDAGTLLDWLKKIDDWLDHNKNEVITLLLVNSANATTAELAKLYRQSELDEHSYVPSSQSTPIKNWPTLQEMINSNKRVVNWIAPLNGDNSGAPYLLDEFSSVFENSYNNNKMTDYSCQPDRPASLQNNAVAAQQSNRLFLMNHFLYRSIAGYQAPDSDNVYITNSIDPNIQGSVAKHAQQCSAQYNRAPNYVLVDFFNTASPIHVVDELNNVSCCVFGRANVDNGTCGKDGYLCYAQVSGSNSTNSSTTGTTGGTSASSPSATTSTNAVSASQTASGGASGRLTNRASATYAGLAAVFFAALML